MAAVIVDSDSVRQEAAVQSQSAGLQQIQERLSALEKQNRRLKQLGVAILLGFPVLLLLMGQAPTKKTVEANEFILKDTSGNVRARLSRYVPTGSAPGVPPDTQLAFFDEKGKKRLLLFGGYSSLGISGLVLNDGQEHSRANFVESDGLGMGPLLYLADEHGTPLTRLQEGEVLAHTIDATQVSVLDVEGFEASLGVTDLVTPKTGETHRTSAASLVLFDKDKHVIWKAP